jgi:hypothetical protein
LVLDAIVTFDEFVELGSGFRLHGCIRKMIARNAARPASRQRKKYGSGWYQLMFSFSALRAAKGR